MNAKNCKLFMGFFPVQHRREIVITGLCRLNNKPRAMATTVTIP